jgi:hypothetical protein
VLGDGEMVVGELNGSDTEGREELEPYITEREER